MLLLLSQVTEKTYIDALVASMLPRMKYTEGQQDMIVMQHKLIVEYPAEKKKQTILYVNQSFPSPAHVWITLFH